MGGVMFDESTDALHADAAGEAWYFTDDGIVARAVGNASPLIVPNCDGLDLYKRLRRAGAHTITGRGIVVEVMHGYPPRLRYRMTDNPNDRLTVALESDPVVAVFMPFYVAWLARRGQARARASRAALN